MLKRLIENWLTSVSEREFDIPFRLLLEAEGHVSIGHSTVHGPMELGKDIVSWHPTETVFYFFQLKAGDANLSDWANMERQILQLVEVPYTHPNYIIGSPYKPVWVCTGQLGETVRLSLGRKNDEHRRTGKPPVELWERNTLIEKYAVTFFDVAFVDDYFLIDFIRVWSHAGDYQTDEENLRAFLHQYLSLCPSDGDRRCKLHLATYALMMAQLSQRYVSVGDVYSGIDCLLLGIVQLCECILGRELEVDVYTSCYTAITALIGLHLQNLEDTCIANESIVSDLLEPTPPLSEIFELPLRTHSLASKLALHLLLKFLKGDDSSKVAELLSVVVIENRAAFCNIVSERQMGTFWISVIGLLNIQEMTLAGNCVETTLEWFLTFHGTELSQGLPDPYQTFETLAHHHLGIEPDNGRLINWNGQSYFLPVLLKFLCLLDLRDCVERQWDVLSRMDIWEYQPVSQNDLFAFRADQGTTVISELPVTGSWVQIQEFFSQRLPPPLTSFLDNHPEALLFLTLAYPWRTQWREVERYLPV